MKKIILGSLVMAITLASCNKETTQTSSSADLKTQMDSISYNMGKMYAVQYYDVLSQTGAPTDSFNTDLVLRGFEEGIKKDSTGLSKEEGMKLLNTYFKSLQEKKMKVESGAAKEVGIAFLAKNKLRKEVTVLPSGLQYEVITQGSGAKPSGPTSSVTVHYHGTTIEGKVFDSSVERGEPATFALNQVIKGWTEGVQLMSTGSKYRFYIPSDLAYGDRGAGADIKPGATLIFDVELLKVNN